MGERLVISLIGMSGSGKTYWSKKLEEQGFERFGCDDIIEAELDMVTKDVARWMGQPFDPQYSKTCQRYLDLEREAVNQVLARIEKSGGRGNIVIDTTGSVIYLEEAILGKLANMTRVVYLDTPEAIREEKYQQYLADPRPVIWSDSFFQAEGETNMAALARCYPDLLAYRSVRYAEIADVTLSFETLHNPGFTTDQFIQTIKT